MRRDLRPLHVHPDVFVFVSNVWNNIRFKGFVEVLLFPLVC